jgi:hypothetical protein
MVVGLLDMAIFKDFKMSPLSCSIVGSTQKVLADRHVKDSVLTVFIREYVALAGNPNFME